MHKETFRNIRLGIFVITGMVMLIVGLYFVGNNKNMFNSTFKVRALFDNVGGLQTGNNVRYSGIDVGTVKSIEIKNDTSVEVEMVIENKLKNLIRKNSVASIGTDGLMGNKLVNIDAGTPDVSVIAEGDFIPSLKAVNTEEMLRTLELTNSNIAIISANLKTVTENLNKGRGTLYTVLMDTSLAGGLTHTLNNIEKVSRDLGNITNDFNGMLSGVKSGKGTLGMLLNDTATSTKISQTIDQLKESGQQISEMSSSINRMAGTMEHGKGTFSTLLNDSASANNLKQSMDNLKTSSQKLNETLDALRHSFLLRGAFKKADKAKQKEAGK